MSFSIDPILFQDLAACDPQEVVERTHASYDPATGLYRVEVWGKFYGVDPVKKQAAVSDSHLTGYQDYMYLFVLHYLMKATDTPLSGEWVSEKDIPGGAAFFRGPHTLPVHEIIKATGDDVQAFSKACKQAGGKPLAMADAGFVFNITPKIPVAVLFWQGDEDFDGEVKLLFDRTISQHLPLDIIYALAVVVCHSIS